MRQRDLLDKIAHDKNRRRGIRFPSSLFFAVVAAATAAWFLAALSNGQAIFLTAVSGCLMLVYTSFTGTGSSNTSSRDSYADVQDDITSKAFVGNDRNDDATMVKRATLSATKVAQRMREMSPQSSTHSTRFKSAGLQAARAGSHYSSSHDSKGMAVGDSCPDGNAWTNARSLLDFTAAATTLDKKDETFSAGYDNEPSDPAASSVLFWNRDESYDTSPMRNSGGGDCRVGRGTSNGPSPNKSISFSTTPQQQQSASIRRAGRYYASPPESPMYGTGDMYSPGGKKSGTAGKSAKQISKDCLKVLGLELVDDEYILNLKRVLGGYLSDSVYRFDVLVNMITQQLKAGNKISDAQVSVVKGLLGHTLDKESNSVLGVSEMSGVSLSDILTFCRRPDVKGSLLVSDKSSGIVSELTTEYDALLCLFRIPGDHFNTHHHSSYAQNLSTTPASQGNNGMMPAAPIQAAGAFTGLPSASTPVGKGFYSSLYNKPVVTPTAAQPSPQLVGTESGYMADKEANHRSTSYIISRAHQLSSDSYLGKFIWRATGPAPIRQRNGLLSYAVEDAEIVMAVFLHFCDSNFSPLAAAEEHRFSSVRFFDASNGVPARPPHGKADVCIIRKSYDPIHFNIVTTDSSSEKLVELTVRGGRQNVFETILLFLLILKKNDSSFRGNPHARGVMDDIFTGYSDARNY